MTTDEIRAMQARIGFKGKDIDGFWGPLSIAKCQRYLRAMMPSPNPWPATSEAALSAFYGKPGDESQLVPLDVDGLGLKYEGRPVAVVRCHRKVAPSLGRVLAALAGTHPAVLALYAGVYNNRPMRNGSGRPSLHARGAAIDLWPDANRLKSPWPLVATMPLAVMEEFAREGWVSAGAFWGWDAMHFQATR